jgi:bifunctional non-homologous end joining protein LigD
MTEGRLREDHRAAGRLSTADVPPRYMPMIPTQVSEPFHRDGWVYEEKVDGWRILAYKDRSSVRLVSRTGVDHSKQFRGVAEAIGAMPFTTLVVDGEIAIFDQQLRSRFDWLRGQPDELATPPIYIAFDVLYRAGKHVTESPLRNRRVLLEEVLADSGTYILPARRLADNGLAAWAQVLRNGYEGYVAKDEASPYRGGVTRSWLKVKVPGRTLEGDEFRRGISEPPVPRETGG